MTNVYEPDAARAWIPPHGYADIAPTRFERLAKRTLGCAEDS
jgi:hypothetical protein